MENLLMVTATKQQTNDGASHPNNGFRQLQPHEAYYFEYLVDTVTMDTGKGKYSDIIAKNRPNFATDGNFDGILDQNDPDLNLSTAEYVAKKLEDLGGFSIHKDTTLPGQNYYVRAIMENGIGKTVFIRGLIQSSSSNQARELGAGICEHDTAALLAAIRTLVSAKVHWCGNLVVLFQPSEIDDEELRDFANTTQADLIGIRRTIPDFIFAHRVCDVKSGLVAIQEGPAINFFDKIEVTAGTRSGLNTDPLPLITSWLTAEIPETIRASLNLDKAPAISDVDRRWDSSGLIILRFEIRTEHTKIGVHDVVYRSLWEFIQQKYRAATIEIKNSIPEKKSNYPSITGSFHQAFSEHFGTDLSYAESTSYPDDFYVWQCAFPAPYAYWHVGGLTPGKNTAEEAQSTLKTGADAMALAVLSVLGCNN
ncbi:hypothetical protein FQN53_007906 [Emmonsiellopsis sp. PD_33]|nr:hypothetical protein FQN53_007906 [Emmonsiellopsis sp. PD_33]